jgi:hypothetical protein
MVAQCPTCSRKLHGIPFMFVATTQSQRTCPKCRTIWRITARPMVRRADVSATQLDWWPVKP